MREKLNNEPTNLVVKKALKKIENRAIEIPVNDRRAVMAAVLNRALFLLEGRELDDGETAIHPLITEDSIRRRKQRDDEFKFGQITSHIHDLENRIPDAEQNYKKFITTNFQDLSSYLEQIKDLGPEEIKKTLLDNAVIGATPIL